MFTYSNSQGISNVYVIYIYIFIYIYIYWVYRMLGGSKGHGKSRGLYISYRKEMKIMNLEQDFLFTTEYHQ